MTPKLPSQRARQLRQVEARSAVARPVVNGFRALAMSQNYYGDIVARFGLNEELTDRLRLENILYDRDQQGEYFQLYCPTYGDGFIFEIVERRGPYRGYGAPNASFRIAAQKRQLISVNELEL